MDINDSLDSIKKFLNKDYIEKLRILDPRVKHYELYVKLTSSDVKKILQICPNAKVNYNMLGRIRNISTDGIKSFTIYNVTGKKG